jgi:predicted Zn-dependent peptidase
MSLRHTVQEVTLETGSKGLLIDVPDATVFSYTLVFNAGDEMVIDRHKTQIAHLTEHMLCNEPRDYENADVFSRDFTKNSAYSNALTNAAQIEHYGDCPDLEWERIFTLQLRQIVEPKFTEEALRNEQETVLEELGQYVDDDWVRMNHLAWRSVGSKTPSIEEEIASIPQITLDDVVKHYERTYTHPNLRFVIVGKLTEERKTTIIHLLESWPLPDGGVYMKPPLHTYKPATDAVTVARDHETTVCPVVRFVIPRVISHEEHMHLIALRHLLMDTDHSIIYGRLRKEGICYSASMEYGVNRDGVSTLSFWTNTSPDHIAAYTTILSQELQRVANGFLQAADVAAAQQYAVAAEQRNRLTVEDIIASYSAEYLYDESIWSDKYRHELIRRLNPAVMKRLMREFLGAEVWMYGEQGDTDGASALKRRSVYEKMNQEIRSQSS